MERKWTVMTVIDDWGVVDFLLLGYLSESEAEEKLYEELSDGMSATLDYVTDEQYVLMHKICDINKAQGLLRKNGSRLADAVLKERDEAFSKVRETYLSGWTDIYPENIMAI